MAEAGRSLSPPQTIRTIRRTPLLASATATPRGRAAFARLRADFGLGTELAHPFRAESQNGYTETLPRTYPWNVRFATDLKEPAFAPREALGGKDARTLARDLLAMSQEEFSRAFKGSPMKRAKLRGLKRNAATVLGNVGTADDIDVLAKARGDEEPLVREHAAWAVTRRAAVDTPPRV